MTQPVIQYEMRIDFALLREQKLYMLEVMEADRAAGKAPNLADHVLNGVVEMFDFLQDDAVRQGRSELEVFGEESKNWHRDETSGTTGSG